MADIHSTSSNQRKVRAAAGDFDRPYTTVDVVIFTVLKDDLEVLLVQRPKDDGDPFPGQWALPGGFIDVGLDQNLVSCARRKLLEKTGVSSPYLEQLGSWGGAARDPRGWSSTHAYFALISADEIQLEKGANAADVAWFKVDHLPPKMKLAFDHAEILRTAVERLRSKVEYTSLPAFLMQEPFTLPQLKATYEVVLGRPIDMPSFRTRMIAADFLDEAGLMAGPSKRPPMGYRLRDRSTPAFFPRTFSPRSE